MGGSLEIEGGQREIPGADILRFDTGDVAEGQFAVVTKLDASPYNATLSATQAGTFDLGIVAPGSDGELRQVIFRSLAVSAGEQISLIIHPHSEPLVVLEQSGTPISPSLENFIPDDPPEVLGIVQNADQNVDRFGRVVAVLFDEDVDKTSAQDPNSYTVFERVGETTVPVPGALIAGGTQVVTADDQGYYFIPTVPVGVRRIEAANPATGARGSREVSILTAGQESTGIDIILEPLRTVTGRVFNPDGQPVIGQEVRILISQGSSYSGRTFFVRRA
jgi:hypothetical protein